MSKMPQPQWTVTVDPEADMSVVTRALRTAGMVVTDVHAEIGVINGHAPEKAALALRSVAGVTDLDRTVDFQLGPEAVG